MKSIKNRKYHIKDLERHLGVYREKLFYWERTGKIPASKRELMSNYRFWTEADLKKIKEIITGR